MAHPSLFNPSLADISDIIRKFEGNIASVAKYYNVTRETIYQYINRHKELKQTIEEVRTLTDESMLDNAENVLKYCMSLAKTSPKIAQDTAKYVFDKKGHKRGWGDGGQTASQEKVKGHLEDLGKWTEDAYKKMKGTDE